MKRRLIFYSSVTAILFLVIAFPFANASQIESFEVGAGYTDYVSFNLDSGQKFTGSLSVSGGSGNDINFWVTNPQGTTVLNQGRISQGSTFEFTAQSSGAYTLHFDNSFSLLSDKAVVLTYDISMPTAFGFDLGLLLALVAVVVIFLLVIAVFAVALHRRKITSKLPSNPSVPSST